MNLRLATGLVICIFLVLHYSPRAIAEDTPQEKGSLSVGLAWEKLHYQEREEDAGITSDATASNTLFLFSGKRKFHKIIAGFNCAIPVAKENSMEGWEVSGKIRQTNRLTYDWKRADVHVGYQAMPWLIPHFGLRWSDIKQKRTEFVIYNQPYSLVATEKIRSLELFFGLEGMLELSDHLVFGIGFSWFTPFYSHIDNSALSGSSVTGVDGYTYELSGNIVYRLNRLLSVECSGAWGKKHWQESDWIDISEKRRVKFPENDIDFFIGSIAAKMVF